MALLQDLVKRQALREYLELINESDIDERIGRMREEKEDPFWQDDFDDFDDLDDDWGNAEDL